MLFVCQFGLCLSTNVSMRQAKFCDFWDLKLFDMVSLIWACSKMVAHDDDQGLYPLPVHVMCYLVVHIREAKVQLVMLLHAHSSYSQLDH